MGKTENFVVGAVIGAALGAAIAYVFGPAHRTTFDANYQSRLDRAVAEGKEAEEAYKQEMAAKWAAAKRKNTPGQ